MSLIFYHLKYKEHCRITIYVFICWLLQTHFSTLLGIVRDSCTFTNPNTTPHPAYTIYTTMNIPSGGAGAVTYTDWKCPFPSWWSCAVLPMHKQWGLFNFFTLGRQDFLLCMLLQASVVECMGCWLGICVQTKNKCLEKRKGGHQEQCRLASYSNSSTQSKS